MAWLPHGEKNFEDIFIRFGATHERDRRTDRRTLHDSKDRAYASHRAVKPRPVRRTVSDTLSAVITGSALALHCRNAHAKINRKIVNSTPCKIVTLEDFSLKFGTRDYVVDVTHDATFGTNRLIRGLLPKDVKYSDGHKLFIFSLTFNYFSN